MADDTLTLTSWFESISKLRVDIIGDFAGKELFAIHGDSLLLHCLTQARVDFTDGFQLLHAIHAVEKFLANLTKRGLNFHIVWFRDFENLCVPALTASESEPTPVETNSYRLMRVIFIKHLQHHALRSQEIQFEFADYRSEEFEQYRTRNTLRFFLCLDGNAFNGSWTPVAIQYLNFIHHVASAGYSIALINHVQFNNLKVMASVFSPSSAGKGLYVDQGQQRQPRKTFLPLSELERRAGLESDGWSPWDQGKPLSASHVISLTALSNTLLEMSDDRSKACAAAYLLHLCALRRWPLSQRSCPTTPLSTDERESFDSFFAAFAEICINVVENLPVQETWDAYDLLDGRILRRFFKDLKSLAPSAAVADEAVKLAKRIHQLTKVELVKFLPQSFDGKTSKTPEKDVNEPESASGVLPFHHPILERYLESVRIVTDEAEEPAQSSKVFQELTHWHNAKRPIDPKHIRQPLSLKLQKRNQRLMADTIAYSASLTSASGKIINPETIVTAIGGNNPLVESDSKTRPGKKVQQKPASSKGKNTKQVKSGRDKALEEAQRVRKEKLGDKAGAVMTYWDERCREFQNEQSLTRRLAKALKYLNGLSGQEMDSVGAEASLYICEVLASMIAQGKKTGARESEPGLLAMIWSKLLDTSHMQLSSASLARLSKFSEALQVRFPVELTADASLNARRLPFPAVTAAQLKLPASPVEFQLTYCGPYLDRSFDSAPDPRVPQFLPDAWQRRVLDAIDAEKSLLVVAPTSAGKTFISFYAMKKVLRSSDDGVLVYVAPTKALVNQIAAEIQARFSKTYGHDGRSVWAIHTRDYRINNPTGCQVLVTVPHILQIMLLAPHNAEKANSWSRRVRRIIFDEVHCIGQADDGVVWEQLLLLAPCPIIALSATVGNPEEFKDWLAESEKSKGVDLEMIVHTSRYSELRKFMFNPPAGQWTFRGLTPASEPQIPGLDEGQAENSAFSFIHPVVGLANRNRGTIDDITLESRDCLTLWRCMSKHQTKEYPLHDSLSPERRFPAIAKKPDVVGWGKDLKDVLATWMPDPHSPFSAVRRELGPAFFSTHSDTASPADTAGSAKSFGIKFDVRKEDVTTTALPLLNELHGRGALPAILFHFDQDYCEVVLIKILKDLTEAETSWKESSPEWKKKVAEYEKWKARASKGKKREVQPTQGRSRDEPGLTKMDLMQEASSSEPDKWENFDPEAPLDMFSFADRTKLLESELAIWTRKLEWAEIDPRIISALRRGVAVHHSGMNRKYRQTVEILFRKGFLTAVVATGTLALGINMPCKTVVFFGDSAFLTALNYLQAAGRAGRRGFDYLGNVVFAGMTAERAFEIMSSRLPDLRGHFPLSTTMILRILGLLHHTSNSEFAVKAVNTLFTQTRICLGGPENQAAMLHHLRFSIEYLRRQQLLSRECVPINFSGLVGHLYFTENAVFALHALIKEGYFHRLCANIHKDSQSILCEMVLVLAHLFVRVPVYDKKRAAEIAHKSPSMILLPPLPQQAKRVLSEHNRETLGIFRNYVSTFVEQHLAGTEDTRLPFTGHDVVPQQKEEGWHPMVAGLQPTKLRSPFDALSGLTDDFKLISELCNTVRTGVFLEESAVPYVGIYPEDTAGVPWNAYIFDFFKHGDLTTLVRDNGIRRGDVWFLLKDFSLVLAMIVTSLENLLSSSSPLDDDDNAMLDVQDAGDMLQEARDEKQAGEPMTATATATATTTAPEAAAPVAIRKATKKKVVLDSWDDEGGDDDDDDEIAEEEPQPSVAKALSATSRAASEAGWRAEEDEGLTSVLAAFKMLQADFDEKFKKIWA
ncbi:DEAD-like helicase [Ophiocordyceps camponoti-floridani]|uniref:DEAD-like helicase n=1 Tax=Ophiocordyceps camponoti-floridani TaxID=2030778 RepID=A0A8H4VAZ7_9HYPO|nr:DEAD-like helicase [Ophiocordyceps camponoti-floridani]